MKLSTKKKIVYWWMILSMGMWMATVIAFSGYLQLRLLWATIYAILLMANVVVCFYLSFIITKDEDYWNDKKD